MSKRGKALATTAAVAAGPSGIKRLLAGCLMVVLLGGLALGALLGFAAWTTRDADREPKSLPCPPETVAVIFTPRLGTPAEVPAAVEQALREAGRKTRAGGWGSGEERDLVVSWTPGSTTRVSSGSGPTRITLGKVPTAAEVTEALGARLAPCEAETEATAPVPAEPQEPAQEAAGGVSWPWERGWSVTGWLGLAVGAWWIAGPNLLRGGWRVLGIALWPLRLGWRKAQRGAYGRRLRQGSELPAEWPEPPSPGQRWHEDEAAMHDRRTYRAQIAAGEPERRAALRGAIREERLGGWGIGPASLWRVIYRHPAPEGAGAPEKEEVSP